MMPLTEDRAKPAVPFGGAFRLIDFVLSNMGPVKTIELTGGRDHFDSGYLGKLDASPHEAPVLHVSFVTDEPLIESVAIEVFLTAELAELSGDPLRHGLPPGVRGSTRRSGGW